jgi:outer membrane biosynthesis protein TonB
LAPNLMVVVPTSHDVKLTYGETAGDKAGRVLTLLGVLGVAALARYHPSGDPAPEPEPAREPEPADRDEPPDPPERPEPPDPPEPPEPPEPPGPDEEPGQPAEVPALP